MFEWNVIRHNINRDTIEVYNVFRHGGFQKDVEKAMKTCQTREDFSVTVKSSLLYYFWCKSEWEILLKPWCGSREQKEVKVDVYWQIMNNWDRFIDYLWKEKEKNK